MLILRLFSLYIQSINEKLPLTRVNLTQEQIYGIIETISMAFSRNILQIYTGFVLFLKIMISHFGNVGSWAGR